MKKYWSSRIKNQQPYVFGEQPKDKKYIKLNTNENPYPPSPRVFEAIQAPWRSSGSIRTRMFGACICHKSAFRYW